MTSKLPTAECSDDIVVMIPLYNEDVSDRSGNPELKDIASTYKSLLDSRRLLANLSGSLAGCASGSQQFCRSVGKHSK